MNFESLIFDIDGTLWDSRALVAEGYNIQLRAEGLGHLCVTAEDLKKLFGKTCMAKSSRGIYTRTQYKTESGGIHTASLALCGKKKRGNTHITVSL